MSCGRARIPWRGRRRPTPRGRSAGPLPSLREYRPELPESLTACVDACLHPEPEARPPLDGASPPSRSRASVAERRAPGARRRVTPSPATRELAWLRASQLVALTAWGLAVTLVAAPLGRPGLALVLGALDRARPSWSPPAWRGPPSRPRALLGALSAAPVIPGRGRVAWGGARARDVLAALGWCWLLVGAATLGLGSRLGPHPQGSARLEPLHVRGRQRAAVAALDAGGAVRGRRVRAGRGRPRDSAPSRARRRGPARGPAVVGGTRGRASAWSPMAASAAAHC